MRKLKKMPVERGIRYENYYLGRRFLLRKF